MPFLLFILLGLILVGLAALLARRLLDLKADRAERARLLLKQPADPPLFSRKMVAHLPDPARRFFAFSIREGTPLFTVAELSMRGQLGLGDLKAPNYLPMCAKQVLAAPEGFLWQLSGGAGVMRVSGSDSGRWTRMWLAGLVPVARAGGSRDHSLSAFGRCICEALFWTPAALMPRPGVVWSASRDDLARVRVAQGDARLEIDITIDSEGRPLQAVFQRWSNANPDRAYRLQPFGGTLSVFREVEGFRIPTHVEAGNHFGTDAYFPFFIAEITDIRFAPASEECTR